jgi:hypothetical protein
MEAQKKCADVIADLINPQKLATLGQRGANPRILKCVYWLKKAEKEDHSVTNIVDMAVDFAGYTNSLSAKLTKDALLRNLKIAEGCQCLDEAGMKEMRQGKPPAIQRGKSKGDQLCVCHIVPSAVCPELDKVIANLELMPSKGSESKNTKMGTRQIQRAEELHKAGLLSKAGLKKVMAAK